MKRIPILCAICVIMLAGTALAGSDRILMEQSTAGLGSDGSYTSDTSNNINRNIVLIGGGLKETP